MTRIVGILYYLALIVWEGMRAGLRAAAKREGAEEERLRQMPAAEEQARQAEAERRRVDQLSADEAKAELERLG